VWKQWQDLADLNQGSMYLQGHLSPWGKYSKKLLTVLFTGTGKKGLSTAHCITVEYLLISCYTNLQSELSPDGGVAGTTSIGPWLEGTHKGPFLLLSFLLELPLVLYMLPDDLLELDPIALIFIIRPAYGSSDHICHLDKHIAL